jgi:6-phosphogluconolactonase/glucosamine-6-phosphate isomerase/deaminase
MPVLEAARETVVLVSGTLKAAMLAAVLEGRADVPARAIAAAPGDVAWMADAEAASALRQEATR